MLNKCAFIGNLTRDPEAKNYGNEGKRFAVFSIAVTEKYKDKQGDKKSRTEYINITAFVSSEFILNYLHKGDKVYVECKYSVNESNGKKYPQFTLNIITPLSQSNRNNNQQPNRYNQHNFQAPLDNDFLCFEKFEY